MNEAMKLPRSVFDCHICGVSCTPIEIELSLSKRCLCTKCRDWQRSV